MTDIVVTWPSKRKLDSYLKELERAERAGLVINYRISRAPKERIDRCYLVHGGMVRGYNDVIEVCQRGANEVVVVDRPGLYWPKGWYVVRKPKFIECQQIPMRGFQGWRYFDRELVEQ